jgi:hypothetical protein
VTARVVDWLEAYLARTQERSTTALAVVPLVLIYGIGLRFASPHARSGVDILSGPLLTHLSATTYVGLQAIIALALVVYAIERRERRVRDHLRWALPAIIEACLWGAAFGAIVIFLMGEVHLLAIAAPSTPLIDRTVIASGAGLHEELVFRLLALPLIRAGLGRAIGVPSGATTAVAVLLSALAFSLAHHLAGEPFEAFVFAYRLVAGCVFGALFVWRGFAVAAWTHAAYDFSVL